MSKVFKVKDQPFIRSKKKKYNGHAYDNKFYIGVNIVYLERLLEK